MQAGGEIDAAGRRQAAEALIDGDELFLRLGCTRCIPEQGFDTLQPFGELRFDSGAAGGQSLRLGLTIFQQIAQRPG